MYGRHTAVGSTLRDKCTIMQLKLSSLAVKEWVHGKMTLTNHVNMCLRRYMKACLDGLTD